ncbi:hypothetical protein CSB08_00045 [Candidatus Gracilibacteria bacterium]|nr:MAG: hypothetical protein CSB08_00045 [Candidatus Gracilibacteria bacterium]PIE85702.1 MAG: hypothetical protein CSA08_00695 [Candidatus Gracilibacteria bacterium]
MKHKKKGFTVVELVTVMIILIIFATIGFMSYGGYLMGVRDTSRITQVAGINKSLNSYGIKAPLPLPDDYVTVEVAGGVIGYQGYAGKEVLRDINYKKGGKDPLDNQYFTYYLTKNRKHSQMLALLEAEQVAFNGTTQTYADAGKYEDRIIHVFGKQLGVLTEDLTNTPIQEVESIKSAKKLNLTIATTQKYRASFKDKDFVVKPGNDLVILKEVAELGGEGCTGVSGEIVCNTNTVGIKIKGDDENGRKWSDDSFAKSCNDYRRPPAGYFYEGDIGNGVYVIEISSDGSFYQKKVYCDMTLDGGGWTYATKFVGKGSLFKPQITANPSTFEGTSVISMATIDHAWSIDNTPKKDIMIKCKTTNENLKKYEIPFIIKDYKSGDLNKLMGPFFSQFSSQNLNASWNGNNYVLSKQFLGGNFSIKDNSTSKMLWKLNSGNTLYSSDLGFDPSPAYSPTVFTQTLDENNYCITAIR